MITIKKETKKAENFVNAYNGRNWYANIWDAYERPSYNKIAAWNDCINKCRKENGHGCIIISRNTFTFTAAWQTSEGLRVETGQNSYLIQ